MTSGRMGKKLFRKLHLWLSVPFGILIALICFSGAMLVFEDEVTQWAKPHLYRVSEPSGTRISTEEAAALVAATLPEGVGVRESRLSLLPTAPTRSASPSPSGPQCLSILIRGRL